MNALPVSAGTHLGPYEILDLLGAGGMGEVYRATDTNLKRTVAIKVLPESVATDAERLTRFQREAEVLARLNHPNIAQIHGLEKSDGTTALVMELVEGPTLADRIAQGPIALDEAFAIAKQIAEALEAAHDQGIIHRDLKPANIKVRPDGTVKVLDFGLAKALEPAGAMSPGVTQSPTVMSPAVMTGVGVLLGTAAYMSPEQARGQAADKRSDVWAFGCVLYEMLSGKRAFEGEDISDTLAAVLRGEPDWSALPVQTPANVRTLLTRCLAKDRRQRLSDIAVALFLLNEPLAQTLPAPAIMAPPSVWQRALPLAAAAIVASAITAAVVSNLRPSSATPPPVTRFSLALGEGQVFSGLRNQLIAVSPDGAHIVYVANNRLFLRAMSDPEARAIPGTDGMGATPTPAFSPDGGSIVYWASDVTLKRIAVSGGAAVTICPADQPWGMSWGKDGILFAQVGKGIMRVSATGGKANLVVGLKPDEEAYGPEMLPDGTTVLFTLANVTDGGTGRWDKARVVVQSIRTGERRTLVDGGSDARYLPTGHIVYALGGTVFAVPFDARRLEVSGGPAPVIEGVRRSVYGVSGAAQFSVSNTGSLIYVPGPVSGAAGQQDVALFDRKGVAAPLKLPAGSYDHPRASPDGKRVAFGTNDGKEAIVWIYDLSGTSAMRRLTFGSNNRFPIWSADGQRVAFQSDREGAPGIFWQRADGSGAAERLTTPEPRTSHIPEAWSPDGGTLMFSVTQDADVSLWSFTLRDKKAAPFGAVHSTIGPATAAFSPDGRWVAYYSNESGPIMVYVQPFPATGAKYQISKEPQAHHPLWSPDGKEILYIPTPGNLASVTVTTEPTFTFSNPVLVPRGFSLSATGLPRNFDITRGGKLVGVLDSGLTQSGPFGVTQTQSGVLITPRIEVVLNWSEELKARLPTK